MVEYTDEDPQHDYLGNIPEEFWVRSGYNFGDCEIWEPTPADFDTYYDSHEALVAHMLTVGLPDILSGDIRVPEFIMNQVPVFDLRGFPERNAIQRIGFQYYSDRNGAQIDFSHDFIQPAEAQGFQDDPTVGLYHDVAPGKKHTAKAQILIPRNEPIEVHVQAYPTLNRPRDEITRRIGTRHKIKNFEHPFMGIKNESAKILLSKVSAYIQHFGAISA